MHLNEEQGRCKGEGPPQGGLNAMLGASCGVRAGTVGLELGVGRGGEGRRRQLSRVVRRSIMT